jgi:hypothetical protein
MVIVPTITWLFTLTQESLEISTQIILVLLFAWYAGIFWYELLTKK